MGPIWNSWSFLQIESNYQLNIYKASKQLINKSPLFNRKKNPLQRYNQKLCVNHKKEKSFKGGENSPTEDMAGNVVINTAAEQVNFIKVMLKSLLFFEAN